MKINPKIHILGELKEGPYGGGNQFLKGLKKEWRQAGYYTDVVEEANYILFNSYQQLLPAIELKRKFPRKIFIHRLGPIFHYHRGQRGKNIDKTVLAINHRLADFTIFQSQWSYQESTKLGFAEKNYAIIGNAPDPAIFNRQEKMPFNPQSVKLISTSWSNNPNKGFNFFQYLDEKLDFRRFSLTFIGNSPSTFKNIPSLPPMDSQGIAHELKQADIFIAPFKHEAASNSILEALACGLPVIALDSGGNAEEVKSGGELFHSPNQLLAKIEKVMQNYDQYQRALHCPTIKEIAARYEHAIQGQGSSKPKPPWWFLPYLSWKLKRSR